MWLRLFRGLDEELREALVEALDLHALAVRDGRRPRGARLALLDARQLSASSQPQGGHRSLGGSTSGHAHCVRSVQHLAPGFNARSRCCAAHWRLATVVMQKGQQFVTASRCGIDMTHCGVRLCVLMAM